MVRERDRNRGRSRKKRRKGGGFLWVIFLLMAVGLLVVSLYMLAINLLPYFQGAQINEEIRTLYIRTEARQAEEVQDGEEPLEEIISVPLPNRYWIDFEGLRLVNEDVVAWLRFIEPEDISYPVVQSHDNIEYLYTAFDGTANSLGSIFIDKNNGASFREPNVFIHGHNMRIGGEMFSQLSVYREKEFALENPYFFIYTPDGMMRTYRVFAASQITYDGPLYRMNFADDEDFLDYLQLIEQNAIYFIEGIDLSANSRIVTLSTCTNVRQQDRFVVHGLLIDERAN